METVKDDKEKKVTRSLYLDSSLVEKVETSSLVSGDKNFNREAIRMIQAQLETEKTK